MFKRFSSFSQKPLFLFQLLFATILIVGMAVGFFLINNSQDIRQQASAPVYRDCARGVKHGSKACSDFREFVTCQDGLFNSPTKCAGGQICQPGTGECIAEQPRVCPGNLKEGETTCLDSKQLKVCRGGNLDNLKSCSDSEVCINGQCTTRSLRSCSAAAHGQTACLDTVTFVTCNDGSYESPTKCSNGATCRQGKCEGSTPPVTEPKTPVNPTNTTEIKLEQPPTIEIRPAVQVTTPPSTAKTTVAQTVTSPQKTQVPAKKPTTTSLTSSGTKDSASDLKTTSTTNGQKTTSQKSTTPTKPITTIKLPTVNLSLNTPSSKTNSSPDSYCYSNARSCYALNRYPGEGCSFCSGSSVCCGNKIPESDKVCTPNETRCITTFSYNKCNSSGTAHEFGDLCQANETCLNTRCVKEKCTPGSCVDGKKCGVKGEMTTDNCSAKVATVEKVGQKNSSSQSNVAIAQSQKVCDPAAERTCSNNRVRFCKPDGSGYLLQSCSIGMSCQDGKCVGTQNAQSSCTCSGSVKDSAGTVKQVTLDLGKETTTFTQGKQLCYSCVPTGDGCGFAASCGVKALAVDSSDNSEIQNLQKKHSDVQFLGKGETVSTETLDTIDETLSLIPKDLYKDSTIIVGNPNSGGGANHGNGVIDVGNPGCDKTYTQNPYLECGYEKSILVHELLHSSSDDVVCTPSLLGVDTCQTMEETFIRVSAIDGITYKTETSNVSVKRPENDFMLYSLYPDTSTSEEAFALAGFAYMGASQQLRLKQPAVYNFFRDYVFDKQEYIEIKNSDCVTVKIAIKSPLSEAEQRQSNNLCQRQ